MTAYHWNERVQERIGNVDPDELAQGIVWAIENDRCDLVQFVCRVSKSGRRVFRFRVPDGRFFFALINTNDNHPLTVLQEGWEIRRQGKSPITLRAE